MKPSFLFLRSRPTCVRDAHNRNVLIAQETPRDQSTGPTSPRLMRDSTSAKMADDMRKRHRRFMRQLLEAVDQRTFDVVGRLIDDASSSGLEVDQSTASGPTALHSVLVASIAATSADVVDVCRRLVAAGADVHRRDPITGETPLHVAAKLDRSGVVEVLVDAVDVDIDAVDSAGSTPLGSAIESGCVASARVLIRAGCSVNK